VRNGVSLGSRKKNCAPLFSGRRDSHSPPADLLDSPVHPVGEYVKIQRVNVSLGDSVAFFFRLEIVSSSGHKAGRELRVDGNTLILVSWSLPGDHRRDDRLLVFKDILSLLQPEAPRSHVVVLLLHIFRHEKASSTHTSGGC